MIDLVVAVPLVAALLVGSGRMRWHEQLLARWRRLPRLVRFSLLAFVLAGCHESCLFYARSPVDLGTLPFREPLHYVGGEIVRYQNGLLASYFAGTHYATLDHQQIDPNVDFTWNVQDPPVPGSFDSFQDIGMDTDPPRWGVWSVVWEGYLAVPTEGDYVLATESDDGSWLEMKDDSGNLVIVVDNGPPNGDSTVTAPAHLTAGMHYIRMSYFQSQCCGALARLLWQPPGAAALEPIPASAFFTQAAPVLVRRVVYVHGTTGSFKGNDFPVLLDPLRARYRVSFYTFYEDHGNATSDTNFSCLPQQQRPIPGYRPVAFTFPVDSPDPAPGICDSNDDLELNAIILDGDLGRLSQEADRITLISNSGGAPIVRAYLAYAAATSSPSLTHVDSAVFLEGVQSGSYLAALYAGAGLPQQRGANWNLVDAAFDLAKIKLIHDPRRPVFPDVLPQGDLQAYVARAAALPDNVNYINVSGDIVMHTLQLPVLPWMDPIDLGYDEVGDFVMLPGVDDPTQLPANGGSRFLPSVIGRGASSTQWILHKEYPIYIDSFGDAGSQILAGLLIAEGDPAAHRNLSRMNEMCVQVPGADAAHPQVRRLPGPIIDAITALDQSTPDPGKVGFGTMRRVDCP
jgi:hypothetical protein